MAWQDTFITIVRALINDMQTPYRYEDGRIEDAVVVSALLVNQEFGGYSINIGGLISYTFDFATPNISPDPTQNGDYNYMALIGLKTACLLSMNDYQNGLFNGGLGVKVGESDSLVDTTGQLTAYKDIVMNGVCTAYSNLLKALQVKKSMMSGLATMTPFTHEAFLFNGGFSVPDFYNSFRF